MILKRKRDNDTIPPIGLDTGHVDFEKSKSFSSLRRQEVEPLKILSYGKYSILPFYYQEYVVVVITYQSSDLFFSIIVFPKMPNKGTTGSVSDITL